MIVYKERVCCSCGVGFTPTSSTQKKCNKCRTAKKEKVSRWSDSIFAFDIETSPIYDNTGKMVYSKLCSYSIMKMNINDGKPFSCYYGNSKEKMFSDFNELIESLGDQRAIVYAHNLDYEYAMLTNWSDFCDFLVANKKEKGKSSLFKSKSSPISINYKNLLFIDSFKITLKGIGKLGDELGVKKLTDSYGGYEKWRVGRESTEDEKAYNERDNVIALLSIKKVYDINDCIRGGGIEKLSQILTSTGIVRATNKFVIEHKFGRGVIEEHIRLCKRNTIKEADWQLFNNAYFGGVCLCNPKQALNTIVKDNATDFLCIDITSSYPYVMLACKYPSNFKPCTKEKGQAILDKILKMPFGILLRNWQENVRLDFIVARVRLINVKSRNLNENEFPVLPFFKTLEYDSKTNRKFAETGIIVNGKVYKGSTFEICTSTPNLFSILLAYEVEKIEWIDGQVASTCSEMDKYTIEVVRHFARLKNALKCVSSLEKAKKSQYNNYTKLVKYCEKIGLDGVKNFKTFESLVSFLTDEYGKAKAFLNSEYGVNVENPIKDSFEPTFSENGFEIVESESEYNEKNFLNKNFIYGLHITSYARLHLSIMWYELCSRFAVTHLYTDTDSHKFFGKKTEIEKCRNFIKEYNETIKNRDFISYDTRSNFEKSQEIGSLGTWDFEHEKMAAFKTLGCKKYVCVEETENGFTFETTVAGMNKTEYKKVLEYFFQNETSGDMDGVIDTLDLLFSINVAFCKEIVKKKTSVLSKATTVKISVKNDIAVIDENGFQIESDNCIVLNDVGYILLSQDSPFNRYCIASFCSVQNKQNEYRDSYVFVHKCEDEYIIESGLSYKQVVKEFEKENVFEKVDGGDVCKLI